MCCFVSSNKFQVILLHNNSLNYFYFVCLPVYFLCVREKTYICKKINFQFKHDFLVSTCQLKCTFKWFTNDPWFLFHGKLGTLISNHARRRRLDVIRTVRAVLRILSTVQTGLIFYLFRGSFKPNRTNSSAWSLQSKVLFP